MQSSRGSSVWRSLAVAFGDGLAFGVGMKLTQTGARPAANIAPPPAQLGTVVERLAEIEHRILQIEHKPAAIAAPQPAPHKLDQQVLEAIVQAVEQRLREQATHIEAKISDLEARVAGELKNVYEQVRGLGNGAEKRIGELNTEVAHELLAVRREMQQGLMAAMQQVGAPDTTALGGELNKSVAAAEARQAASLAAVASELRTAMVEADARNATELVAIMSELRAEMSALAAQSAELRKETAAVEARQMAGHDALRERTDAVETRVAGVIEERLQPAVAMLGQVLPDLQKEVAAVRAELADAMDREAALENAVEAHVSAAIDSRLEVAERNTLVQVREATEGIARMIVEATQTTIERRVLPLETAMAAKDVTIAELREQARQKEREVLDLLTSIGRMCESAALRLTPEEPPVEAPAEPAPDEAPKVEPVAAIEVDVDFEVEPAAESEVEAASEMPTNETEAETAPAPPAEVERKPAEAASAEVPSFAEPRKPGRVWRIPLVSSLVLALGGWAVSQLR